MTDRLPVAYLDPAGAPDGYLPQVAGDKVVLGPPPSGTGGGGGVGDAYPIGYRWVDEPYAAMGMSMTDNGFWKCSTSVSLIAAAAFPVGGFAYTGDIMEWNLAIGPGTYNLIVWGDSDSSRGNVTWGIDDGDGIFATLGTTNFAGGSYTAPVVLNVVGVAIGGFTAGGRKLRATPAAGKTMGIGRVALVRTA